MLDKELRTLLVQPIAYAVAAVFLLIMGYTFSSGLALTRSASLVRIVFQAAVMLLLLTPLVTMRLLAEERRQRTLEMLFATPVRESDLVFAKFVASMLLVAALLLPTLVYPALLAWFGEPDWGPVYSGYLGLLLLAAALNASGLALSAMTENQIVAAVLAFGLFLSLWLLDTLSAMLSPPWDEVAMQLSLLAHFAPFATGSLYFSDVGFFVAVTLLGLYLAIRALARR